MYLSAPMQRRRFATALLAKGSTLALAAVAPLVATGCSRREAAPQIAYTLLDGRGDTTTSLRGKVVLVNFWATSCVTCVQEMPSMVATWRHFQPRGYDMLAVAMQHDPPALVARFAETRALPFGVVIDNTGAIAQAFGHVRVTPTTFLIDKRGDIVARLVGAPDFAALHAHIERLLAVPA